MYIAFLFVITIFIPTIQTTNPTIKLSFSADGSYFKINDQIDVSCELLNPAAHTDTAQLWHVDLNTHKRTSISRALVNSPPDDAPDIFKRNQDKRIEYLRKNSLRFHHLTLEDSARFECNCPDCEQLLNTEVRDLMVTKHVEPQWNIDPPVPIPENSSVTFRCFANDFFPYSGHQILRHHHDITSLGTVTRSQTNSYPQSFSWEATLTVTADWHNSAVECILDQATTKEKASTHIQVSFTPRFLKCDERQHVDSGKEESTIECSYSGYPEPQIEWVRQSDGLSIHEIDGIRVTRKDGNHGNYTSIVTFERDKLAAIPTTTTTRAPSNGPETSTTANTNIGENYYQQLLHGGFAAKLILDNEVKGTQRIQIVSDAKQARVNPAEGVSTGSLDHRSTSILLFFLTTFLYLIQHP